MQRDARALLPGELAALERDLAGERAQERRLPGAVRAGEREPVAALDLEGDAVEEDVAGELLAERGCDQDRHGCKLSSASYADRRARRRLVLGARDRLRRGRASRSPATRTSVRDADADELVDACRAVLAQVGDGDALAVSCFWHSLLPLDERERPLSPLLTWRDVTGDPPRARSGGLPPRAPAASSIRRSGRRSSAGSRGARYVSFADYLLLELTGELRTSVSMASGTGVFDPNRLAWDDETLDALGARRLAALADLRRAGRGRLARAR